MSNKFDERYATMMATLPAIRSGKLRHAMAVAWNVCDSRVGHIVIQLRAAGYDMSEWDRAAWPSTSEGRIQGRAQKKQTAPAPTQAPSQTPDHVQTRRVKWLADMQAVVDEPAAIELLCERWGCSRDIVHGRADMLRNAGHDLTWWRPSRGFGTKKAPVQALKVDLLPLPTVDAPKREKRQIWAAEVPYTMQSIADIVGMPVMAVRFAARAHGIGFDRWCLAPDVALGLLAALGFERAVAA
jgi:hypothetical protein